MQRHPPKPFPIKWVPFERFVRDTRANVAITFALVGVILILVVFMAVDISNAFAAKNALQDATDAAALAVATDVAKNPDETEAQLKVVANAMLKADFQKGAPKLTSFHVCAAVQNDCAGPSGKLPMNTVSLTTDANVTCLLFGLSSLCGSQGAMIPVSATTTTSINFGVTMQLNILMDSSASMIVGATSQDVTTISNWVSNNWAMVKPGDPPPYTGGDNPPCAFACHDVGGATQPSDIATGLTNAHTAGATTRFDVMITAAQGLISHLQTESQASNSRAQNTMVFNIMSFDTALHTYGTANTDFTGALSAIGKVSPGLDTWMATAMGQVITQVGANGNGTSTASPYKFVILVTDGLQSDRSNNWTCTSWFNDTAWNYNPTCTGGYATSINAGQCAQLKANGVILAVLETPYVPLTGQDPNVQPYEKTVRHVIFPNGPGTPSTISQALSTCASPGYYFQAANSSDIATGFATLADKFVNDTTRIVN
ncbi:MAG TPA: pilus assembly protein TadG-related protein [Caulobacteraceae bacterium]|nr:pilus assembly protein TadG-related protein [Caulobacteraceae bacterium]